jgi:hypothetical protein
MSTAVFSSDGATQIPHLHGRMTVFNSGIFEERHWYNGLFTPTFGKQPGNNDLLTPIFSEQPLNKDLLTPIFGN